MPKYTPEKLAKQYDLLKPENADLRALVDNLYSLFQKRAKIEERLAWSEKYRPQVKHDLKNTDQEIKRCRKKIKRHLEKLEAKAKPEPKSKAK